MPISELLESFFQQIVVVQLVRQEKFGEMEARYFVDRRNKDLICEFQHVNLNDPIPNMPGNNFSQVFMDRIGQEESRAAISHLVSLAGKYFVYSCLVQVGQVKLSDVSMFYASELAGLEAEIAVIIEQEANMPLVSEINQN